MQALHSEYKFHEVFHSFKHNCVLREAALTRSVVDIGENSKKSTGHY